MALTCPCPGLLARGGLPITRGLRGPTLSRSMPMIPLNRRWRAWSSAFALLVATLVLPPARAQEPGFKPIFNGKDLTGWRSGNTELAGKTASDDGRFAVKDSVLVISGS